MRNGLNSVISYIPIVNTLPRGFSVYQGRVPNHRIEGLKKERTSFSQMSTKTDKTDSL